MEGTMNELIYALLAPIFYSGLFFVLLLIIIWPILDGFSLIVEWLRGR
jgi:hypothetical protein